MSAQVEITRPRPGQLVITLRQGSGEVWRFLLFTLALVVGLYFLVPAARTSPVPLLVLLGAATGWAGFAWTAREEYRFDHATQSVAALRSSLLGHSTEHLNAREVRAVRLALGGPDDDRRLVELVGGSGEVHLRLPRRLNTFRGGDQAAVGEVLAEHLRVPLQPAQSPVGLSAD